MESEPSEPSTTSLVIIAVGFEFSLALVAVLLGWILSVNPFETLQWRHFGRLAVDIAMGGVAAVPLLVLFFWARRRDWASLRQLRSILEEHLLVHLQDARPSELALISLAAGFGEEVLFRGCLQEAITSRLGESFVAAVVALILSSLIFGAAHFVSWTYLILATVVGLYFGWLLMMTRTLWIPVTAHALYDFIALQFLQRDYRKKLRHTPKKSERPDP